MVDVKIKRCEFCDGDHLHLHRVHITESKENRLPYDLEKHYWCEKCHSNYVEIEEFHKGQTLIGYNKINKSNSYNCGKH